MDMDMEYHKKKTEKYSNKNWPFMKHKNAFKKQSKTNQPTVIHL